MTTEDTPPIETEDIEVKVTLMYTVPKGTDRGDLTDAVNNMFEFGSLREPLSEVASQLASAATLHLHPTEAVELYASFYYDGYSIEEDDA